ncbi:MAG: cadmium-translocating P-type ATPase [Bacteroidales bacterium]|nr:cadmium-translocating P-type ATPase [Bacteroidales bacterium]
MEAENKNALLKLITAAVLLVAAMLIEHFTDLKTWQYLLIYLIPYLAAGYGTLKEAVESLLEGEALDEDFLMSIATLGALFIGFLPGAESQFPEAVFVMLFFQLGEFFEELAEDKSRDSISALMDIRSDTANVERDGNVSTVSPDTVEVGETIIIRPGERIPMDGTVLKGDSSLDTAALTGESVPRTVHPGSDIISGCVNLSGLLKVRVTKPFGESTASRILDLVENAGASKSRSERFITRFARIYTPIVVALAVLIAILPPLLSAGPFATWLYRALTFLIVSCPCALVISVPLAFFGGIGGASRRGILVKGGNYLEALTNTDTVIFDKTGTLTEGVFEVTAIHPETLDEQELLHIAAHVERHSTHPIAISLRNAFPNENDDCTVTDVTEIAGKGIQANVNGHVAHVGNSSLMDSIGAQWKPCDHNGTIVHVAIDNTYTGHIVISDRIKTGAREAIEALRKAGVRKTVMLTGDAAPVAEHVARALGIDEYHAELLPADKVNKVNELKSNINSNGHLVFVGDGINDAPVLAGADVGMAMGALGSDAAIEAADVVLMDDELSKVAESMNIARKTVSIATQNTTGAIAVKVLVLILATLGFAPMWLAVFADVGVTVLAIINSMRTLR